VQGNIILYLWNPCCSCVSVLRYLTVNSLRLVTIDVTSLKRVKQEISMDTFQSFFHSFLAKFSCDEL
jgi:hypothetical protein